MKIVNIEFEIKMNPWRIFFRGIFLFNITVEKVNLETTSHAEPVEAFGFIALLSAFDKLRLTKMNFFDSLNRSYKCKKRSKQPF